MLTVRHFMMISTKYDYSACYYYNTFDLFHFFSSLFITSNWHKGTVEVPQNLASGYEMHEGQCPKARTFRSNDTEPIGIFAHIRSK